MIIEHVGWVERDMKITCSRAGIPHVPMRLLVSEIVAKPNSSQHADWYTWLLGLTIDIQQNYLVDKQLHWPAQEKGFYRTRYSLA